MQQNENSGEYQLSRNDLLIPTVNGRETKRPQNMYSIRSSKVLHTATSHGRLRWSKHGTAAQPFGAFQEQRGALWRCIRFRGHRSFQIRGLWARLLVDDHCRGRVVDNCDKKFDAVRNFLKQVYTCDIYNDSL